MESQLNSQNKYKRNREKENLRLKKHYEENKEEINKKTKKYYESNKDDINRTRSEKIICECGENVSKNNIARHKTSKLHIDIMIMNELD